MGRRSSSIKSRNRALLGMVAPPVLLILLVVAGLYVYEQKSGNSGSAVERAISDCVRDHTRVSTASEDQAASDCVRDSTADGDR